MAVCRVCSSEHHTTFLCPRRARKPLRISRRLNKVGKASKRTSAAVTTWKQTQEPNHEGYYECYICGRWITYLEAEHVKSKARHPELRTDPGNLRPTCSPCNQKKGSHDAV